MTHSLRTRFACLGLAAAVTLATLLGLHVLAHTETAAAPMAAAAAQQSA
ncbi:MAG: hypothetical protein U1E89_09410 [Burkholderiaceae bacterium]